MMLLHIKQRKPWPSRLNHLVRVDDGRGIRVTIEGPVPHTLRTVWEFLRRLNVGCLNISGFCRLVK